MPSACFNVDALQESTELYVQHMVTAPDGVDPDLLEYIYEAGTNPGPPPTCGEICHRLVLGRYPELAI